MDSFKPPSNFWKKLNRLPAVRQPLAEDLKRALEKTLPEQGIEYKVVRRQAGLGSLGQERFVAIAKWQGGCIAREAKLLVPSACSWLNDKVEKGQPWYEKAISSAVRSPDPFQVIDGLWLIRRLSPDSNPIDIERFRSIAMRRCFSLRWVLKNGERTFGNEGSNQENFERTEDAKAALAAGRRGAHGKSPGKRLEAISKGLNTVRSKRDRTFSGWDRSFAFAEPGNSGIARAGIYHSEAWKNVNPRLTKSASNQPTSQPR